MTLTIRLDKVFSRFLLKIKGRDLFDENITPKMRNELLCGYVRSALAEPFVRREFMAVWLTEPFFGYDEDGEFKVDGLLEVTMLREVDEESDREFVLEIMAYGMVHAWAEPILLDTANLEQFIGTADAKLYSQSNHITTLQNLVENLEIKRNALINQRQTFYNDYLDGKSNTATLRKTTATG